MPSLTVSLGAVWWPQPSWLVPLEPPDYPTRFAPWLRQPRSAHPGLSTEDISPSPQPSFQFSVFKAGIKGLSAPHATSWVCMPQAFFYGETQDIGQGTIVGKVLNEHQANKRFCCIAAPDPM